MPPQKLSCTCSCTAPKHGAAALLQNIVHNQAAHIPTPQHPTHLPELLHNATTGGQLSSHRSGEAQHGLEGGVGREGGRVVVERGAKQPHCDQVYQSCSTFPCSSSCLCSSPHSYSTNIPSFGAPHFLSAPHTSSHQAAIDESTASKRRSHIHIRPYSHAPHTHAPTLPPPPTHPLTRRPLMTSGAGPANVMESQKFLWGGRSSEDER